ncbi:MAG: SDR family NAD(P)-dependent oxidoreductase [Actinomycetota bacterium]|nr:SDR family NAD(P)-dependent oxidoreductase [Actinomycetota bacterium]
MPAALVTGAGGGLGLAIARMLAQRDYEVAVTDVDRAAAERAAGAIGTGAWPLALDVTDAAACDAAAAAVATRSGALDVWVNNAGILLPGLVHEQDPGAHRAMLDVNTLGTFNGTLAALAVMRPAGRGHVINVVSLAGLVAAPGEVAYAASKHAAIAFSIGTLSDLRRAGIKGIDVSAICPDGIWSPMLEDKLSDPDAAASFSGTMLTPGKVAARVEGLLEKPRPVVTIPRWRGATVRLFDAFPRLTLPLVPLVMADARRRQARFKRKLERQSR